MRYGCGHINATFCVHTQPTDYPCRTFILQRMSAAAFNQAFTIWLLRGTFMSISSDMEQAATIDGCNRIQAMIRFLLPVAAPGIVTP